MRNTNGFSCMDSFTQANTSNGEVNYLSKKTKKLRDECNLEMKRVINQYLEESKKRKSVVSVIHQKNCQNLKRADPFLQFVNYERMNKTYHITNTKSNQNKSEEHESKSNQTSRIPLTKTVPIKKVSNLQNQTEHQNKNFIFGINESDTENDSMEDIDQELRNIFSPKHFPKNHILTQTQTQTQPQIQEKQNHIPTNFQTDSPYFKSIQKTQQNNIFDSLAKLSINNKN